jgi:hypothetical protein
LLNKLHLIIVMSGVKMAIHCPNCNDCIGFGTSRTKGNILGGHLRHCKYSAPQKVLLAHPNSIEVVEPDVHDDYLIGGIIVNSDSNPTFLEFQQAIHTVFNDKQRNCIQGRVICEDGAFACANWQDFLDIMQFKVNAGLSLESGNDMLSLIRNLCKRRKLYVPIPTTMRTIVKAFDATRCSDYGIKEIKVHFDRDILSPTEFPTLKPCTAATTNASFLCRIRSTSMQ